MQRLSDTDIIERKGAGKKPAPPPRPVAPESPAVIASEKAVATAVEKTLTWQDGQLVIGADWTADDYKLADVQLRHLAENVIPLQRGRLMVGFMAKFKSSAEEVAAHFGCKPQTVYNLTSVARRVPTLPAGLTTDHARAVASATPARQKELLDRAVDEGLSANDLRIAKLADDRGVDEEEAQTIDRVTRALDLVRSLPRELPASVLVSVDMILAELSSRGYSGNDTAQAVAESLKRARLFTGRLPATLSGASADDARALGQSLIRRGGTP